MRLFLTIVLTLLLCNPAVAADSAADLAQTNRLLQAEFELAKSQQLYFIFDLPTKKILFRVSGITVAELPVVELRSWGRPADGLTYTLAKRHAAKEPKREQVIIPDGKEEEKPKPAPAAPKPGDPPKEPELQALELGDMPTEYELTLDDGTLLTIRPTLPATADLKAKLHYTYDQYAWYVSRSLLSISHNKQGTEYNEMLLILPAREARMLYWSFQEGARCLVHWPY